MDLPRLNDDLEWNKNRIMSPQEVINWFGVYGCGWINRDNPQEPHWEINGRCITAYFDCQRLFNLSPRLCEIFAWQIAKKIREAGLEDQFNWVIGSSSSIIISYEVARILRKSHGFTESRLADSSAQSWAGTIPGQSKILQVEADISSMGIVRSVRQAIGATNCLLTTKNWKLFLWPKWRRLSILQ
jgi:hypothetical protein